MLKKQENAVAIIGHLNQLIKAVVDFKELLRPRLDAYCEAHANGENPILRIPSEKWGIEPVVSQAELARIFYALHFKFPAVDNKLIHDGNFLLENEVNARDLFKTMLEVASDLKIKHDKVPEIIREWLGEGVIMTPLKHTDI